MTWNLSYFSDLKLFIINHPCCGELACIHIHDQPEEEKEEDDDDEDFQEIQHCYTLYTDEDGNNLCVPMNEETFDSEQVIKCCSLRWRKRRCILYACDSGNDSMAIVRKELEEEEKEEEEEEEEEEIEFEEEKEEEVGDDEEIVDEISIQENMDVMKAKMESTSTHSPLSALFAINTSIQQALSIHQNNFSTVTSKLADRLVQLKRDEESTREKARSKKRFRMTMDELNENEFDQWPEEYIERASLSQLLTICEAALTMVSALSPQYAHFSFFKCGFLMA